MRKLPACAAFLAAAASHATWAQSSPPAPTGVTLYGLVDTGVEVITNVGPNGERLTRMPSNTASLPSRWGLRGSEDLGGGLRAVFTLEAGFGMDTGLSGQGGRLFGRQAFVGLSGPWGTVSFGRQYTMLFWSVQDADILGPNVFGSASLDPYIPNARADNALAYRGTFGGFTVGATYSVGRDAVNAGPSPVGTNCPGEVAGDSSTCREWSAMLKYDAPTWGMVAVVDRQHGGPGAFGGLSKGLTDTRSGLNGWVKLGDLKLGAGLLRRRNEGSPTPRSDLLFAGAAYALSPRFTIDGEVLRLDFKDSPNRATLAALRGTYHLSKRTAAYVSVGHMRNDGALALSVSSGAAGSAPVPGGSQNGVIFGLRHAF